jgi:hypothetical protein
LDIKKSIVECELVNANIAIMLKILGVLGLLSLSFAPVFAENSGSLFDDVSNTQPAVTKPAPEKTPAPAPAPVPTETPAPTPVYSNTSRGFFFFELWGNSAYNSTGYQENRGGKAYDKIITRLQPRIGYAFPIWVNGLTIDPYVGGEITNGGEQEFFYNYTAPAVGVRFKFLKVLASTDFVTEFFREIEMYAESTNRSIYDSTGPKATASPYSAPTGAVNSDFVFGLRNYKEGAGENLWWDSFQRFDHRNTDFQATDYDGWLLLLNGKVGYNFLKNTKSRTEQPWNVGPYVRFETFKNFVYLIPNQFHFENRIEYGLGFQVRYNLKAENVSSSWLRGFIEFMNVSYYDQKPTDTTTPGNNFLIGLEVWNR